MVLTMKATASNKAIEIDVKPISNYNMRIAVYV
jgi:hypothetical protein